MAHNGDFPPNTTTTKTKRRNNKPAREASKREIHRLIVSEALSNRQLCDRLHLPKRTLDRYLSEIFNQDNDLLIRPTAEDISLQIEIFKERLTERMQKVLKIADDSMID